jgi:hypothetical protein
MVTRVAVMVLRVCALVAIVLGILFWTGNADGWRDIHMTAGILLVLSLWTIAIAQVRAPGGIWWLLSALVIGIALAAIGMTQENILLNAQHWIIQVAHLTLALIAIALGEMMAGRAAQRKSA